MGLSEMTAFFFVQYSPRCETTKTQNPVAPGGEVSDLSTQKTAINLTAVS
jgi:hypothetical protein